MKKLFFLCALALILTICLSVVGCKKPSPSRTQRSSGPTANASSNRFPYITSSKSNNHSVNRNPSASNSQSQEDSNSAILEGGDALSLSIFLIGVIDKSNYLEMEERIVYCEETYNQLNEEEKQKVTNYSNLVSARESFNQILLEENSQLIEEFKNKVNNLGQFADATEFKQKVNDVLTEYEKFHKNLKPNLQNEFEILSNHVVNIYNYEQADNVILAYNQLGKTITNANVGNFRKVILDYNNLNAEQKSLISEEIQNQINEHAIYIAQNYTTLYKTVFEKDIENSIFSFVNATITLGDGINYAEDTVTKCAKLNQQGKLLVFAPYGGELTIYAKTNGTINVYKGSEKICSIESENNKATIFLEEIATYSITFSNSSQVYAVEFN